MAEALRSHPFPPPGEPLLIGLAGGVGSGKSAVARALEARGALVIDGDALSRKAVEAPAVRTALRSRFGDAIFRQDGALDRDLLSAVIFRGPEGERRRNREDVEGIIHPAVRAAIESALRTAREAPPSRRPWLVVLDAPLLFETSLANRCHAMVFVDSTAETRTARTLAARSWDACERERREAAQLPLEEKRLRSHYAIANQGTREDLTGEVDQLVSLLSTPGIPSRPPSPSNDC